jgi:hypothetical protein
MKNEVIEIEIFDANEGALKYFQQVFSFREKREMSDLEKLNYTVIKTLFFEFVNH